jgi:large subunit ribosomal protein L35
MPKQKTHKGLAKRVRITASGKVRHKSSFTGHLMSGKSGNRKRALRKPSFIGGELGKRIKRMLGK